VRARSTVACKRADWAVAHNARIRENVSACKATVGNEMVRAEHMITDGAAASSLRSADVANVTGGIENDDWLTEGCFLGRTFSSREFS
jgi:hypothetical protein